MGTTRDDGSQQSMWVSAADLPRGGGHPFYERLNRILEAAGFDAFVEGLCAQFYAAKMGRPGLAPGRYFRLLLIGYFEGLDSRTSTSACKAGQHDWTEDPMADWSLQDAKNRFSVVVDSAVEGTPQRVTRRGRPAVVVLAAAEYERLRRLEKTAAPTLADLLIAIPQDDEEFERLRVPFRSCDP